MIRVATSKCIFEYLETDPDNGNYVRLSDRDERIMLLLLVLHRSVNGRRGLAKTAPLSLVFAD